MVPIGNINCLPEKYFVLPDEYKYYYQAGKTLIYKLRQGPHRIFIIKRVSHDFKIHVGQLIVMFENENNQRFNTKQNINKSVLIIWEFASFAALISV